MQRYETDISLSSSENNDEFVEYQLLLSTDIPQSGWESATDRCEDDASDHVFGCYLGFLEY